MSKSLKVIDAKGLNSIYASYRLVPYPEIEKILKDGGEAFVEGIDRRTAWGAKHALSKHLKVEIKAESRIFIIDEAKGTALKGYLFIVEEEKDTETPRVGDGDSPHTTEVRSQNLT